MTRRDRAAAPAPGQLSSLLAERFHGLAVMTAQRLLHRAGSGRPRSGWHAYRPAVGASMPTWAVELALSIERPVTPSGRAAGPQALLLVRAAGPWRPVASAVLEAAREVESLAGVGEPLPRLGLVRSSPEPGLDGLPRRVAVAHLGSAGRRGRATTYRRRSIPEAGGVAWRQGAGAVLTCTGRAGVSAQAVVAITGQGALSALRPPPGGATIVRAWRCRRAWRSRPDTEGSPAEPETGWAFAAGVVLASPSSIGLGRVARRYAVLAREAGWNATVLNGASAVQLARAGDPRCPAPTATARPASRASVLEFLTACLTAGADQTGHPALPGAWSPTRNSDAAGHSPMAGPRRS